MRKKEEKTADARSILMPLAVTEEEWKNPNLNAFKSCLLGNRLSRHNLSYLTPTLSPRNSAMDPLAVNGENSRFEKSLGLLTTKFVTLLQEAEDGLLDLKVVRKEGHRIHTSKLEP